MEGKLIFAPFSPVQEAAFMPSPEKILAAVKKLAAT